MSIYDKASLVLIPSGTKTSKVYSQKPVNGDGDFTFSRSTAATRVNASGNIEKETQNLLLQSNSFDTTWSNNQTTETGGQAGYDGSSDAWLLTPTATGGQHDIRSSLTGSSGVYTWSAYVKAGGIDFAFLQCVDNGGGNFYGYYNLSNGSNTSNNYGGSGTIVQTTTEDVGGGWYRLIMVLNGSGAASARIGIASAAAAGAHSFSASVTDTIYVQDAQLEQGLVARDYIETTTAAVEGGITDNVPRLDYTDSSCPALLLEPQRTNLVPISEGVPENYAGTTITENYGTSPEGVTNSLKVTKTGGQNDRIRPINDGNAVLVNGRDYTISAFVKNIDVANGGITTIACRVVGGTLFRLGYEWNGASLTKSAQYGGGGTRVNEILEDYGNGWWRIGFGFEADGTTSNMEIDVDRLNGSDTTSIETWGWQFESATGDASYATSYIPTYGTSVTRNADACNSAGDANTFNDSEGVLYAEIGALSNDLNIESVSISDTSAANRVVIFKWNTSNAIRARITSGGSNINLDFQVTDITSINKIAVKYKTNDFALWINGVEVRTNTNGSNPSGLNQLAFNSDGGSGAHFYGNTKQILYFPTALSNTELAALTTI